MDQKLIEKVWDGFPGQVAAKSQLNSAAENQVHAYMFLGESGTEEAAFRFAAAIHAVNQASESEVEVARTINISLSRSHPDTILIEPEGSTFRVVDAEEVIGVSATTPLEGLKKVVIVPSIDEIEPAAVGKLLKTIEEPPSSVVFILLAQTVLPEIVTIASRCTQIVFAPYSEVEITEFLVSEGIDEAKAALAARAAGGNIDRATLLATDESLADRSHFWATLPSKLDGSGSRVAELVNKLQSQLEEALVALDNKHSAELISIEAEIEAGKANNQAKSKLAASQKREVRKFRNQELRFGMALIAANYRDELVAETDSAKVEQLLSACDAVQHATEALIRNPNETLLLQDLLYKLPAA